MYPTAPRSHLLVSADAGFDEVYIQQIGLIEERFFELYANEVLPRFTRAAAPAAP